MKNAALWIVLGLGVFIIGIGVYAWSQEPIQKEQVVDVSTSTVETEGLSTYKDPQGQFSFSYLSDFDIAPASEIQGQPWSMIETDGGILHAKVNVPRSIQPNTNFGDARITVGSTDDQNAVSLCATAPTNTTSGENITINGIKFFKITQSDAGAGQFYETVSYRTVWNEKCYSIEYTIHSSNIGAYDPGQGITEFNQDVVINVLEGMVQSFTFIELANQTSSFDGILACLPHRDVSGPVTMECTYGIQTESGTYYALHMDSIRSQNISSIAIGTKVRVSGSLVPALELETSREWKIYAIVGIMKVSSVAKI
ncbi:MAG TPA: hypothetical protein PLF31_02645 [Candidatus Paceibacterota bacterium]|nr:hypothetical protein [Candidatus Paceibacterota bacterium]